MNCECVRDREVQQVSFVSCSMAEPIRAGGFFVVVFFIQSLAVFTKASIIISSAHNDLRSTKSKTKSRTYCHNSVILWVVAKVF